MDSARITRRTFALGSGLAAAALTGRIMQPFTVRAALPEWERLAADRPGPAARWDHTLSADDEGKQLLVFGGRDANFAALGDTWLFDLDARTWRQIDGEAPAPRFGQAVVVDQKTRRLYLFGGQSQDVFFNDTWQFDFKMEQWKRLDAGESAAPSPRYGLSGVLDGGGHLIVSHGFTFEGRFDDTWSFDLKERTWTDVSPSPGSVRPLRRCLHEMVWDAAAKRMLLYGGCSSGFGPCPQGDLWSYNAGDRTWAELTPAGGPSARSNPALVWHATTERAWLFGGLTDGGYRADLWSGVLVDNVFTWTFTETAPGPAPRASHDTVVTGNRLYLFGGTGDAGPLDDLWRLKPPS